MKDDIFTKIMIEPTNLCNLRCPVCSTGMSYEGVKRGFMTFEQFKTIIMPVKNKLQAINLYNLGEPFLAPDIYRMLEYIDNNKILSTVHTNGLVFSDEKINYFIKHKSQLCLVFSIDGITQESYKYYRVGGKLDIAMENLKKIVKIKHKYNKNNIQIIWQFLVHKKNENEVEKSQEIAKIIGVDAIRFKTINISEKDSRYDNFIPSKEEYRRIKKNNYLAKNKCDFLDPGMPVISWNGDVQACCTKPGKNKIMGNTFKENILDIWNNNIYIKFRNDLRNNRNSFCNKYCASRRKCVVYSKVTNF